MLKTEARVRMVLLADNVEWKGDWTTADKVGGIEKLKDSAVGMEKLLEKFTDLAYVMIWIHGEKTYFNPARVTYARLERKGHWEEYEV